MALLACAPIKHTVNHAHKKSNSIDRSVIKRFSNCRAGNSAFRCHGYRKKNSREGSETEALPTIWDSWEDFTALARQFTEDGQELVTLSDQLSAGTQSAEDQSRAVRAAFFRASKSCSGCHERFRLD
jgi:cytochrome c556